MGGLTAYKHNSPLQDKVLMSNKNKKIKQPSASAKPAALRSSTLSSSKKRIFWIITLSFPFLLVILLEISLRIFNYGGNLDLFIEGPEGYENYLRCNPEVAGRYFYMQSSIPTPPLQLFRREKLQNSFRIVVLGESSTAGFPYGNNASFPNILRRGLSNAFPEKDIEVINIAMAAINSYTLLDLTDEIFEQKPDVLLIYTGHNEYYGALGVGSLESMGNSQWLIKTYLKLQSFKTFLLLRNFIGSIRGMFSSIFYKGTDSNPSATLMERIVAEQTIPYGSSLYENGKEQFKNNMEEILSKASKHGVKVILSELVSNVKDQRPFISVKDEKGVSAEDVYSLARKYESEGKIEEAKNNYFKAKDMDALRFRASEDFNLILRQLAREHSAPLVQMISYFENESSAGIIGNELMLEHLHPNKRGYFLLAKGFYDTMQKNSFITKDWPVDNITPEYNNGITELDSIYANLVILHLKQSWPFKPKSMPNTFLQAFQPANHVEEVAFRIMKGNNNFNLEAAHMELGDYYQKQGELDKAFREYNALITSIPHEMEFYQKAAVVLLNQKKYPETSELLTASLKYKPTPFAYKWIGQIALMDNNYSTAIENLKKADLSDDQVIFNLARAFYYSNQLQQGDEYYARLRNLAPRSKYLSNLTNLRMQTMLKAKSSKTD